MGENKDTFVILQGEYEYEHPIGFINDFATARNYCAQENFKLGVDEDGDCTDSDNKLSYKRVSPLTVEISSELEFHDAYDITFDNTKEGYILRKEESHVFTTYVGEIRDMRIMNNSCIFSVRVTADSEEKAIAIGKAELDKFLNQPKENKISDMDCFSDVTKEVELPTENTGDLFNSKDMKYLATKLKSANADLTEEQIIDLISKATWKLIDQVEYEDSNAKIFRTTDLNSHVNCLTLEDLDEPEDEKYIVYTNVHGERSVYLKESSVKEIAVPYCDIIIDSEDGLLFAPPIVMQCVNDIIKDDIDDGTEWNYDLLELFGISMVALYPNPIFEERSE